MTAHPHDALFKSAFESAAHAAALLSGLLPPGVRDAIAWRTLESERGSFIDAALAGHHSDLLFSARLVTGAPVLLYLLLEHQSTGDPVMPLRVLTYQVRIWNRGHSEQPHATLAPVIAVVISHVPGGWTDARAFHDLFAPSVLAVPGLPVLMPQFSLVIEDLAHLSNDELKARSLATFPKLALWLLRDARDPARLLASFDAWITAFLEVERAPGGLESFTRLLTYMFRVIDPVRQHELHAKIRLLGRRAEEVAMTIADEIHEEGRAKGHEEGRARGQAEGRRATLRQLLLYKFQRSALEEADEARLAAITPEAIDRYLQRVLTADSLAAVFVD